MERSTQWKTFAVFIIKCGNCFSIVKCFLIAALTPIYYIKDEPALDTYEDKDPNADHPIVTSLYTQTKEERAARKANLWLKKLGKLKLYLYLKVIPIS